MFKKFFRRNPNILTGADALRFAVMRNPGESIDDFIERTTQRP